MKSGRIKRIAIYIRCSTTEQDTSMQLHDLQEFTKARGWLVHKVYEDYASGTTANRKALKEMLQDAKQRKFDVLVVWKLDRLFRSLRDMVTTLHELGDLGIEFVALRDQVDLTTASGRLMTHMLSAFAEFEASLIRGRVVAGLESARRRGQRLGRPRLRDDDKIRSLRHQGLSERQIAIRLGISRGAVQRSLRVDSKPIQG